MVGKACGVEGVRPGTYCEPRMSTVGSQVPFLCAVCGSRGMDSPRSTIVGSVVEPIPCHRAREITPTNVARPLGCEKQEAISGRESMVAQPLATLGDRSSFGIQAAILDKRCGIWVEGPKGGRMAGEMGG